VARRTNGAEKIADLAELVNDFLFGLVVSQVALDIDHKHLTERACGLGGIHREVTEREGELGEIVVRTLVVTVVVRTLVVAVVVRAMVRTLVVAVEVSGHLRGFTSSSSHDKSGAESSVCAEGLWVVVLDQPFNESGDILMNKLTALGSDWAQNCANLFEFADNLFLGLVVSQINVHKLDNCLADFAKRTSFGAGDLHQLAELNGLSTGAQANFSAEGVWIAVFKDPFNKSRGVVVNKNITSGLKWAKELANFFELLNNFLLGLVLLSVGNNVLDD